jgi:hypothetical protein
MKDTYKLHPCPLCGSTEQLMVYKEWFPTQKPDGIEMGVVECTTFDCPMIIRAFTIEEAVEKWNKRPLENFLINEHRQTSELYTIALDEIILLKKQLNVTIEALGRISDSVIWMRDYPHNTSVINEALDALTKVENIRKEDDEHRRKSTHNS